jgi:hypothetical protein
MRFRILQGLLLAGSAMLLASCGGDDGGTDPGPPEEPLFPADYRSSGYMLVADGRFSTEHSGCVEVHCDPGSAGDYTGLNFPLAEGTVLVKAVYPVTDPACAGISGAAETGWAVMKKLAAGSSPATGDWYWQELDADRNVVKSNDMGNVLECVSCHMDYSAEDWTAIDPLTRQ